MNFEQFTNKELDQFILTNGEEFPDNYEISLVIDRQRRSNLLKLLKQIQRGDVMMIRR